MLCVLVVLQADTALDPLLHLRRQQVHHRLHTWRLLHTPPSTLLNHTHRHLTHRIPPVHHTRRPPLQCLPIHTND